MPFVPKNGRTVAGRLLFTPAYAICRDYLGDNMAATPTFTCTCGVQKKTSNHWILAICTSHDVRFMPWDWNLALDDNVIVLCGERCAAGLLSRSMGDWKAAEFAPISTAARAIDMPRMVAPVPVKAEDPVEASFATELRDRLYARDCGDRD